MQIKRIKETFRKFNEDFRLLQRQQCIALYERKDRKGYITFEVHKVRLFPLTRGYIGHQGMVKKGYTHTELLASNEAFGNCGWAFQEKENAMICFKEKLDYEQQRKIT